MFNRVIILIFFSALILLFFAAKFNMETLGVICLAVVLIISFLGRVSDWCGTIFDIFKFVGGLFTNKDKSENKEGEN